MVTRKPLPLEGKPEGSRTPRSCVTLWKTPIGKHVQGGNTIPNSTLSTYRLVAALTLCNLQMLLQVLPPQATPIDWTSLCESCKCVCEWMKWIQFVWHKQFNREQLLEPNKSNWQTLNNDFKGWFSYSLLEPNKSNWQTLNSDFKGWFSYSQGTITKSTTSKTRWTYNMDLGSLNDTRKLSQRIFWQ